MKRVVTTPARKRGYAASSTALGQNVCMQEGLTGGRAVGLTASVPCSLTGSSLENVRRQNALF